MTASFDNSAHRPQVDDGDRLRAAIYTLLADVLTLPPSPETLHRLSGIELESGAGGLFEAWQEIKQAAERPRRAGALDDEFHALFVGLGRGELMPYGSWYLSGSVMDAPLAKLREDLRGVGLERLPENDEPEDHIAALCESMALLIEDARPYRQQQEFFAAHIGSWSDRFFGELQRAEHADFYRSIAKLGIEFVSFEQDYLNVMALTEPGVHHQDLH